MSETTETFRKLLESERRAAEAEANTNAQANAKVKAEEAAKAEAAVDVSDASAAAAAPAEEIPPGTRQKGSQLTAADLAEIRAIKGVAEEA